jgi:hypothetical protein
MRCCVRLNIHLPSLNPTMRWGDASQKRITISEYWHMTPQHVGRQNSSARQLSPHIRAAIDASLIWFSPLSQKRHCCSVDMVELVSSILP